MILFVSSGCDVHFVNLNLCYLDALEKSARAAGLPTGVAEQYAAQLAKQFPGNIDKTVHK